MNQVVATLVISLRIQNAHKLFREIKEVTVPIKRKNFCIVSQDLNTFIQSKIHDVSLQTEPVFSFLTLQIMAMLR